MGNESNSGKVIAIIVAVAVIVGGIAFFAMSGNDEESTASTDTSTSQEESSDMAEAPAEQNIVELAQATPDLSTLVTAVVAADLAETLSGDGPFTAFAPTNEAFEALPAGTLDDLLKPENKDQLTDVLTYHVVAGDVMSSDLTDGQEITTLQGDTLTVKITDGVVTINGATVTTADVDASNGVVHVIDQVLLPS
jgi:uncharacterized surface protein with fasciclin (FAS1) repeats